MTETYSYLIGVGVTHSIAPPMHNFISTSLGHPNRHFLAQECPTIEDAIALLRAPTFAGAVITMPYKRTIMDHLDGLDPTATKLGACNNVYRAVDGSLRGTNTDWIGIKGSLLNASDAGMGKPALIVGAGGAARAAVYALFEHLGCKTIYVVNRDEEEVRVLGDDVKRGFGEGLSVVHVQRVEDVATLESPFYIVGTVPDAEPSSAEEIVVRDIVHSFLQRSDKGVLLDMCFKPRNTRLLKAGRKLDWKLVEGTEIIGHQIHEQYRLWDGEEESSKIPVEGAWRVLRQAAEENPMINF